MSDQQPGEQHWERKVLEKVALAAIQEQRRSRQWGMFFKMMVLLYLFALLFIGMGWLSGGETAEGSHTALIDVSGVIGSGTTASADKVIAGMQAAFKNGELTGDVVVVVRFQGPKAVGMPELHKLTPQLGILQDRGHKVALLTDGRMSGASGKVPAAIHMTPEASDGGAIAKIRDGDLIRLDANEGTLTFLGDEREFFSRTPATEDLRSQQYGMGRELFAGFRALVGTADNGASVFG